MNPVIIANAAIFIILLLWAAAKKKAYRKLEEEYTQRNADLEKKERLLDQLEGKLRQRKANLKQADAELKRKGAELDQQEAELDRKSGLLDQRETELDRKQAEIDRFWTVQSSPNSMAADSAESGGPVKRYPDFETISAEAALAKQYCRWRAESGGKDPSELEKEEAEWARRAEHLWLDFNYLPQRTHRQGLLTAADCYELLEVSTRLLAAGLDGKLISSPGQSQIEQLKELSQHCADALCLLKTSNLKNNINISDDPIQFSARNELLDFTRQSNLGYLVNMKAEDRLPVEERHERLANLLDLEKRLTSQELEKQREPLRQQIREELGRIKENPPGAIGDWNLVVAHMTSLVQDFGVSVKSAEIRNDLSPFLEAIPDEIEKTPTFVRIIQYLEIGSAPSRKPPFIPYSDGVKKVRKAFGGTKVVFVGGTPQPHFANRLKEAFHLNELIWKEWSHGDSLDRFRSLLNDENVKLFLVYIPWCSHKHSRELTDLVNSAKKGFVRLRKGTGINVIASNICEQAIPKN